MDDFGCVSLGALALAARRRSSSRSRVAGHFFGRILFRRRSEGPVYLFLLAGQIAYSRHFPTLDLLPPVWDSGGRLRRTPGPRTPRGFRRHFGQPRGRCSFRHSSQQLAGPSKPSRTPLRGDTARQIAQPGIVLKCRIGATAHPMVTSAPGRSPRKIVNCTRPGLLWQTK